jgi:hypothetical protein
LDPIVNWKKKKKENSPDWHRAHHFDPVTLGNQIVVMQNEAPETRSYAVLAHHLTKNGFEKMRDPERYYVLNVVFLF